MNRGQRPLHTKRAQVGKFCDLSLEKHFCRCYQFITIIFYEVDSINIFVLSEFQKLVQVKLIKDKFQFNSLRFTLQKEKFSIQDFYS